MALVLSLEVLHTALVINMIPLNSLLRVCVCRQGYEGCVCVRRRGCAGCVLCVCVCARKQGCSGCVSADGDVLGVCVLYMCV